MYLYLVQHAEANSRDEDPERGLTEKGWADAKKMADFADRLACIKPAKVFHSGKTRAAQTAETFEDYLQPPGGMKAVEGLGPIDDPRNIAERIEDIFDDVILVGHLPHLAKLASLLLCGEESSNAITFKNAGIVCLNRTDDVWTLEWIVTPEILE